MRFKLLLCFLALVLCILLPFSGTKNEAGQITVITREEGSGTRSAFCKIFGLYIESDGKRVDVTYKKAEVTAKTAELLISVSLDKNSIGYTSLGTLGEDVKALSIDGVAPSTESIKSEKYPAVRSFFALTAENITPAAEDFLLFIMSREGEAVINSAGYIASESAFSYVSADVRGRVRISGSSSVYPVIEKLAEEYRKYNSGVRIELQQSDSSSGIRDVISGTSDIGLSSREPSASELKEGVTSHVLALDGIAVIVNKENPLTSLTKEQVRKVFAGEIRNWSELEAQP